MWNKSKQWKITMKNQCYLQFLNKRERVEKIKNWIIVINVVIDRFKSHITDFHDSRINKEHVWWTMNMKIEKTRKRIAKKIAQMHKIWRIQINNEYRQICRKYYKIRIAWEFNMIKKTASIHDVVWLKNLSIKQIVKLSNSKNLSVLNDYRKVVEKKRRFFKKKESQNSNIIENDELKKSKNEKIE